jgi:hypothetical protein
MFQKCLNVGQSLGLTNTQSEPNKIKKIKKNEKPAHIVLLCHIPTIQVDKQGLHTFKQKKSCIQCDISNSVV